MKITPKEDIVLGPGHVLEAGNTYDSAKQGMPDEHAERYYQLGVLEIEGREPCGERIATGGQPLRPKNLAQGQSTTGA